jgi:hypothetical protein
MKKWIIIFVLIFLVGCAKPDIEMEEGVLVKYMYQGYIAYVVVIEDDVGYFQSTEEVPKIPLDLNDAETVKSFVYNKEYKKIPYKEPPCCDVEVEYLFVKEDGEVVSVELDERILNLAKLVMQESDRILEERNRDRVGVIVEENETIIGDNATEECPCLQYHYGTCPEDCVKRCLPSTCNDKYCTADCEGPGSCSCP